MKETLNYLFGHNRLTQEDSKKLLLEISEGKYNNSQVAVFMGVYMMRAVTVEELTGFKEALIQLCIPFDLDGIESTDLCGTGGDGKNTFNISTTTSFVVAGAGYKVTKHGNYGVSSICGSSNVLENLGYTFSSNVDNLKRQIDKTNMCFIHAPLFHPAMKFVGPIRRELGVKTFFNMLGPLVNPAQPTHQTVGVFSLELARLYQFLLEKENREYTIVHALDGYDELSLTNEAIVINRRGESILNARDFNLKSLPAKSLYGGDTVDASGKILINILKNQSTTSQKEVVLSNASLAIKNFEKDKSLVDCYHIAEEALESGKAYKTLTDLIELS